MSFSRKSARRLLTAAGTTIGAVALLAQPAVAEGVGNPGSFTTTVLPGSTLTLSSGLVFQVGNTGCDDGTDNDADGVVDTADPECTSANDNNERLPDEQVFEPPTVPVDVAADGTLTMDPTAIAFQPGEICVAVDACIGAHITGTGEVQTGTIDPEAGTANVPVAVVVELDAIGVGFEGLPADCQLGPVTGSLPSSDYDQTDGSGMLMADGLALDVIDSCGDYSELVNVALGLPGTVDVMFNIQILDGTGTPPVAA